MSIFRKLDNARLGSLIQAAKSRVVLCIPGFDDVVGSAVVNAHNRLGAGSVDVIVDASDGSARLGYGHFDAVKMISEHGVRVRVEPGLRLGIVVIDDAGWCLAVPALLVDATMELADAPNAIQLTSDQITAVLRSLVQTAPIIDAPSADSSKTQSATPPSTGTADGPGVDKGSSDTAPEPAKNAALPEANTGSNDEVEIGRNVLTPEAVKQIDQSLSENPPQKFDVARKVNVFNAFIEFVEIELTGVQIGQMKIQLPTDLLIAVKDQKTRDQINANFKLIGESAGLLKTAGTIRKQANDIRKIHTRPLPRFDAVILRKEKRRLDEKFRGLEQTVKAFSDEVENGIEQELTRSRHDLIEALLPGLEASPPEEYLAETVEPATSLDREKLRKWLDRRLSRVFPTAAELVNHMSAKLTYKAVTYETLTKPDFQEAVAKAYPDVDFTKPFVEFITAKAVN